MCTRKLASTMCTSEVLPNWKSSRSPSFAPVAALIESTISLLTVFESGDCTQVPSGPTFARAKPPAPMPFASCSSFSWSVRESDALAGTTMALTISAGRSLRYAPLLNFSAIGVQNGIPPPLCSITCAVMSK